MTGMSRAYHKDILRSIQKGWKRFLSILIITALGVAMLTGLYAACLDMYRSADQFYDEQNLFDIRILSTLGLTKEDVEALAQVNGVEMAEGAYSETVYTDAGGARKSAEISVLSPTGLNRPYLLMGTLPVKAGDIAVTQKYMDESGKSVGDTLVTEEDIKDGSEENTTVVPAFSNTAYTITGVVIDPIDIRSNGNVSVIRSAAAADYTFFITAAGVENDMFTAVYMVLSGTKGMDSFSGEYENAVQNVIRDIESHIKTQREQERYDSVILEARTKIEDAESTMHDEFEEADEKLSDAWKKIAEARQELEDGEAELVREQQGAERKIAEARAELESADQKLAEAERQLAEGEAQLAEGEAELNKNAQELAGGKQRLADERQRAEEELAAAEQQLREAQSKLDAARTQLEPAIDQLKDSFGDAWPENEWSALVNAAAALAATGADDDAIAEGTTAESAALAGALPSQADDAVQAALGLGRVTGGQRVLDAQKSAFDKQRKDALQELAEAEAELATGEAHIEEARRTIEARRAELKNGKAELAGKKAELASGQTTLNEEEADAKKKIDDAWQDIADGKEELADGEARLTKQEQEYAEKREEALQELDDAYAEMDDIDMTQWYVQDRTSLDSYSSLNSDLSSIEAVGKVFPVIFLLVAVLMSLTAMTRMVEEERGLIGTYKALGFGSMAIYQKYLLFAFMACLLGGIIGDLFGFVLLPKFVSVILDELYSLPQFYLSFDILYGVGGVLLFMAGIVGATALACGSELSQMPAVLIRPKAPCAGARVFLERIPAIWNRLSFLKKVTVRNLFRYKKRLFMTVGGIMGCTALILCGFAIKDSITDLAPKQYEGIYQYDLMAVFEEDGNDGLIGQLTADGNIEDYLNLRIESVKLINSGGKSEKIQLMVIPDDVSIEDYIRMENVDGTLIHPNNEGILITQNAARILDLKAGGTASLQDMELVQHEAAISGIVRNYLGNNVYMTQKLYESLFGEYVPNGMLAHLSEACADHTAYAGALLDNDSVLSAVSTTELREEFGFDLINAVVLLITVMAGGLAFVVLFTLSNTNISERVRELATIKVLGFYDNEVHQYVNKETLILTMAGILLGLPAGRFISGLLTIALNMPSIHFAVRVEPVSYLISAVVTLGFAIVVNWITNCILDRINMVEALKSVE